MSKTDAHAYFNWLVQKLEKNIARDEQKAEQALNNGDTQSAIAYQKFASEVRIGKSYVENYDIASFLAETKNK